MRYKYTKFSVISILLTFTLGGSMHVDAAASAVTTNFKRESVLKSGHWVKVKIESSGMQRISYATLKEWGFDNPSAIAVYGNGGRALPRGNSEYRIDDLAKCPVIHANNGIVFYGASADYFKYDSTSDLFKLVQHSYDSGGYYFITSSSVPSGPPEVRSVSQEASALFDSYDDLAYYSRFSYNIIKSGSRWLSDRFDSNNSSRQYEFSFSNIKIGEPIQIYAPLIGRSNSTTKFKITVNGSQQLADVSVPAVVMGSTEGLYADESALNATMLATGNSLKLTIDYTSANTSSLGWLEYINVAARSNLNLRGNQLIFRNRDQLSSMGAVKYVVSGGSSASQVWDVTNVATPVQVTSSLDAGNFSFVDNGGIVSEYVIFNPSGSFAEPKLVGRVENQNLHSMESVNYVIVAHPSFVNEALRLAEAHIVNQELSVAVVTTTQIYNEFSSGSRDITAIRDFLRMLYSRADTGNPNRLKYLLLFGDGSFDNRNEASDNPNLIPTYQSVNSFHQSNSYVSDDYYGFLDDNEGNSDSSDRLDIAVGRFPVFTAEQAAAVVNKSITHMTNADAGVWKRQVMFLGDDGDSNLHMSQSDGIATSLAKNSPEFEISKIYLDNYPVEISSSGKRYPDAFAEVNRLINNGVLLFNFVGHGGGSGLTEEGVLNKASIQSWNNARKLPMFITATCEFARFDDKNNISAGELVLLNPNGGGMALFTTTRIAYSHTNNTMNTLLFNNLFKTDDDGKKMAIGTIIQMTKNGTGNNTYKMNFTLLGDPALKLSYPENKVVTRKINGVPSADFTSSLTAMSSNTIEGDVVDDSGNVISDFNGTVNVSIYDKPITIQTLGNEGSSFRYSDYKNIIYKAAVKVSGGCFSFSFIVPKDIRYNIGEGRISYYAISNDKEVEAVGADNSILIGGVVDDVPNDVIGPSIDMYLNNESFRDGQKVSPSPLLIVHLEDESGINTTGAGIGHDVIFILNGDIANPVVLNEYFETDLHNPRRGTVLYQLSSLPVGKHTLRIRAWDVMNNSSEKTINFEVKGGSALEVIDPIVYPNPSVIGLSELSVAFNHDAYNSLLTISTEIFSLSGALLKKDNQTVKSEGSRVGPVKVNTQGVDAGIRLLRVKATSDDGREGSFSKKIMLIR